MPSFCTLGLDKCSKSQCSTPQIGMSHPVFERSTMEIYCHQLHSRGVVRDANMCVAGFMSGQMARLEQAKTDTTNGCTLYDINHKETPQVCHDMNKNNGNDEQLKFCRLGYMSQNLAMADPKYDQACHRCA